MKILRQISKLVTTASLTVSLALGASADVLGDTEEKTVSESQLLARYAQSLDLAAEHLAWANDISPGSKVEKGDELKVPARLLPDASIENGAYVNLAERGFYLFQEGNFTGFYPISVGMEKKLSYHTPTGTYTVVSRIKNPEWHAPDSDWAQAMEKDTIDADSQENPLGEYWFGIGEGYGFHENTAPLYTGDAVSHGCMRMYSDHAQKLYDQKLLEEGDTVTIVNEPVRLAKTDSGELMVAVYPSTYGVDPEQSLRGQLKKRNIVGLLSDQQAETILENKDGIPRPLVRKNVSLQRGERTHSEEPILVGGRILVPSALARDLGMKVAYDGEARQIIVSTEGKRKEFSLDPASKGERAARWGDVTYLKASELLSAFGIPYRWNGEENTLVVEDEASS